jgi:hypothetical protein
MRNYKAHVIFYLAAILFLPEISCQKVEPVLVSDSRLKKKIEKHSWEQCLFTDKKPNKVLWTFSEGTIEVRIVDKYNGRLKKKYNGTYTIGPRKEGARLRIISMDGYYMEFSGPVTGSYSPVKLNDKVLRFVANTVEEESATGKIEGGLKVLEFIKAEE